MVSVVVHGFDACSKHVRIRIVGCLFFCLFA